MEAAEIGLKFPIKECIIYSLVMMLVLEGMLCSTSE